MKNMDEIHFVFNIDDGKALGVRVVRKGIMLTLLEVEMNYTRFTLTRWAASKANKSIYLVLNL